MSEHGARVAGAAIRCEALSVARGGRRVLHEVDLAIGCDECVALIGPNGAGKTSLLLALLGLLAPSGGAVRWGGAAMHERPARERGRLASYVPQSLDAIPAFSVRDVVAGGRYPHVPPLLALSAVDHAAIEAALRVCGLADMAERPLNQLSGGERQKALIAAAIAQDAQVMCLDEPTTALDPRHQVELIGLLAHWRSTGRGLIVVSHDLNLPAALRARVVALAEGRVVADGDCATVLTPDRLEAIFGTAFDRLAGRGGQGVVMPRLDHLPESLT